MTNNTVITNIKERRSIRSFKPEQISAEELHAVLEAGTYAPSGRGLQSAQIVAIQEPSLIKQLVHLNAEILGDPSKNPYYGAPTIILVFAPADRTTYIEDGSCVLNTMMLAAQSIGLGSCWIHRERQMFQTEEGKRLMRQWGIDDTLTGIGALALGYAETVSEAKPRREGYYQVI